MLARRVSDGLRLFGLSVHPGLLHQPERRTGFWTRGTPVTWPNTWGFRRAWSARCGTPMLIAGSSSNWIRSWSRAKWSSSAGGRPLAAPRHCGRTSAHAPNSATRSRSGASIGRCITSTGSSTSLRTRWSMRLWTSRTAVARAVPGDRAHAARCGSGSGACCAGATTAHAWSRDNHPRRQGGGLFLEWKMDLRDTMTQTIRERRGALAVTVASRQRAPMRSRNYLLHIDDAIVSHLSFNQPHVSLRDRAFLRSTALAHMTILPLEQRRP